MSPNSPFCDIAIRVAAVVGKASNSAILRSIDELDRESGNVRKTGAFLERRTRSHLVFLQHHEVEMLNSFFCIFTHASLERTRVNNVPDILIYEAISAISDKVSSIFELENQTYLAKSVSALSPYPFFSVKTISILAYCFC